MVPRAWLIRTNRDRTHPTRPSRRLARDDSTVSAMAPPSRPEALVLAAGAARRFGGAKLLARLDGRPVLQHVLDAVQAAGLDRVVVVLGHDADALVADLIWRGERIIRNPDPDRGMASSLRTGLAALGGDTDAVVILLGDQPLVDPSVIRQLLAEPLDALRPIVAARYRGDRAPNPVRVESAGWPLADDLDAERGFGAVMAARPALVRWIEADGANPDIDTPADLAAIAWAARVRANRDQVDRVREAPDGKDFYGPVSGLFVADPDRTDDPSLDALLALARTDDRWLDVGAGAGRYALPLARRVREVVALDPSTSMLDALRAAMGEHRIANIRVVEGRWPPSDPGDAADLRADVALIAHVGYDVEAIGPFVDALEAAAGRLCVALMMAASPAIVAAPFWPPIHGEERISLPALPEFVDLLRARGSEPEVTMVEREPRIFGSAEELERMIRRQLWVGEGTAKERLMGELLAAWTVEVEGGLQLRDQPPMEVGIVTWHR
jgi:molybdenum cofactor cytidylyltransferase